MATGDMFGCRGRLAWYSASLESWCPYGPKGSNPFPGATHFILFDGIQRY